MSDIRIRRALISVSDKSGLEDLVRELSVQGVEIVSTGGTAEFIRATGINVTDVSDLTGFPEMMDGRVKTLHPAIHGGILACRDNTAHMGALDNHSFAPIDLVIVNLYPFEDAVRRGSTWNELVENIDIGGPALVRSAAKNHAFVAVVVDPADYRALLDDMKRHNGCVSRALRQKLAATAFGLTAVYDTRIAQSFNEETGDAFPRRISFAGIHARALRYGENAQQRAAMYTSVGDRWDSMRVLGGRELSYNNIADADAAIELMCDFDHADHGCAVAIIKHANPCGIALGRSQEDAWHRALACDPTSAFGGIVVVNSALDRATAAAINELFVEVVIAPDVSADVLDILQERKNLRVLVADLRTIRTTHVFRSIGQGILVQTPDTQDAAPSGLRVVTRRQPSQRELDDMQFAFRVAKHVKSNAIVYARDGATIGIGAGQMSRVDSAYIARQKAERAGLDLAGAVVASDAFFPFADGLIEAAEGGITAAIQPGGSIRDDAVIAEADARDMAMVFTGERHFRH